MTSLTIAKPVFNELEEISSLAREIRGIRLAWIGSIE
jgi:hypothetical protein